MALSSRLKLWEQKIKEEKKPVVEAVPPPPISALPGGFLKQLVRETEKETKQKEPEAKEEKAPSKLSDNLVQQFLLPDQTPPILEAEMALRAEKTVNGERGRHPSQSEPKTSPPRHIVSPEVKSPLPAEAVQQEVTSEPKKQVHEVRSEKDKVPKDFKTPELRPQ